MSLKISFPKASAKPKGAIVVCAFEGGELGAQAKALDKTLKGFITANLKNNVQFTGKNGEILGLGAPAGGAVTHITLLGLGKDQDLDALKTETAGGKLAAALTKSGTESATLLGEKSKKLKTETLAAHLANGFALRAYDFDRYKSKPDKKDKPPLKLKTLSVVTPNPANTKKLFEDLSRVRSGTLLARDLVNTAPNDLYPESYAKIIQNELKPLGIEIEIIDDKKLEKLGMGGISAVGQGSSRKPRMVIMRWNGAPPPKTKAKNLSTLGFVGKGVTFDTGGISLKPGPNMDEMKMDMGGSAAVVGLMKTLALRGAKCNAVGVVGLAENMPSSNAYRPGDIIKTYAGKTIEVLNTDAEGRLVLADCLTYIQKTYKPEFIIDLATLTGAILIALGHEYCGTFANDDTLWKQMEKASEQSGEKLWRMPLDEVWTKEVESEIADLQNTGKSRNAGSCTAAAFLGHFIEEGTRWAHMDIAGTAWRKSDQPTVPKFGSGFGVRVLNDLVAKYYES
ncbi:MAG: leucyl aminopeptidase [Rhodospirillales bacterium]|nr:leucyl aminopeptidase [Alphaproteobacteria bacterium]MCB9982045.1 leucyl aminopeptidase [Rhodospirillales bacterium]